MLALRLSVLTVALFAAINEVNIMDLSIMLALRLSVLIVALLAAINEVNIVDLSIMLALRLSVLTVALFLPSIKLILWICQQCSLRHYLF